MKPIKLVLENFGPYQHEEIRFDQFDELPLFLITGKTGSGKTSIFDGICYALYGKTSGNLREGKDMRSNFATVKEVTCVSLTFTHDNFTYQVVREPEQELAKKKGEGTTLRPSKVSLTQLDESGCEINQWIKKTEVETQIEDILKVDVNQFTQLILLPQGDFRKFLNASSDEKEGILRKLFHTAFYKEWASQLKELKKNYQQGLEQTSKQITAKWSEIPWSKEQLTQFELDESVEARLELLDLEIQHRQQGVALSSRKIEKKIEEQQLLSKALQEKEQQEQLFFKWQQELEVSAKLQEEEPDILAKKEELNKLNWLLSCQPQLEKWQENEGEKEQLLKRVATNRQEESKKIEEQADNQQQLATCHENTDKIEQAKQQLVKIEEMIPKIDEYRRLKRQESQKKEQLEQQLEQIEIVSQSLEKSAEQKHQLNQMIQLKDDYSKQLVDWQIKTKQYEEFNQLITQLACQEQKIEDSKKYLADLTKTLEQLFEDKEQVGLDYEKIKQQWQDMQGTRLALLLEANQPCPVCGSLDHPKKQNQEESWTLDQVQALEKQKEAVEKTFLDLNQQVVKVTTEKNIGLEGQQVELAKLHQFELEKQTNVPEELANLPHLNSNDQLLAVLKDNLATYSLEQEKIKEKLAEIAEQEQKLIQIEEKIKETNEEKSYLSEEVQESKQEVSRLEAKVSILLQYLDSNFIEQDLNQVKDSLKDTIEEGNRLLKKAQEEKESISQQLISIQIDQKHITQQLEKINQLQREIEGKITEKIQKSPYEDSFDQLIEQMVKQEEIDKLTQEIEEFKEKQMQTLVRQQQLKEELKVEQQPNKDEEQAQLNMCETELAHMQEEVTNLKYELKDCQQVYQWVSQTYHELKEQWDTLAALNQLSEVANGDGTQSKVSLERFVLQTYFNEVLRLANNRFMQLTHGRYSFQLNKASGSYKKASGLELNVYDDNLGGVRNIHTLSGGESFIAALALSLSLADVIQMQSGSVKIDALFIDEGFGSLDSESLETAMEALESIEGQGKMIGIISHVQELKQRIPQQLQVISDGQGQSRIKYQLI